MSSSGVGDCYGCETDCLSCKDEPIGYEAGILPPVSENITEKQVTALRQWVQIALPKERLVPQSVILEAHNKCVEDGFRQILSSYL